MKHVFRPEWDHYFMAMAHIAAERSTCDRLRAGSVLVKDRRIIATGYNGAPRGMAHCDTIGHLMQKESCIRTLHGEENTLLQAAAFGMSTEGSTLYTTYSPCYNCLKKLIACGVTRIVAGAYFYRDTELLEDAVKETGIVFELYKPDRDWWDRLQNLFGALARQADQPTPQKTDMTAQKLAL